MKESGIALASPLLQGSLPRNGQDSKVLGLLALALSLLGCTVLIEWRSKVGRRLLALKTINDAALPSTRAATSMQQATPLTSFQAVCPLHHCFVLGTRGRTSEVRHRASGVHAQYSPEQLAFLERKAADKAEREARKSRSSAYGSAPADVWAHGRGYSPEQLAFLKRKEAEKAARVSAASPAAASLVATAPAPASTSGFAQEKQAHGDEGDKFQLVPWRVQMLDHVGETLNPNAKDEFVQKAAHSLRENGFVVLEGSAGKPLVSTEVIDRCRDDVLCRLNERLREFEKLTGKDPRCFRFSLAEFCHRSYLRFDVLAHESCLEELFDSALAEASPVLNAAGLLGQKILTGCVVSMPGSEDQHLHADGPDGRFVNIFVPLVDVHAANGPTEFVAGSHKWPASKDAIVELMARFPDQEAFRAHFNCLAPEVSKGSMVIFSYTCHHWGHRNRAQDPRPVAYFSLAPAIPEGTGDGTNFGRPLAELGQLTPEQFNSEIVRGYCCKDSKRFWD